jgi:hypothetical protein
MKLQAVASQASEIGGRDLRGKLIFFGGGQDRIVK